MKLEVAKRVIGDNEDCNRLFEFEIQVRQNETSAWSEPFAFELSHDLAFEFTIPYGYQYRISEEDYSDEGYRTSVVIDGKRQKDKLVYEGTMKFSERVEFVNTKIEKVVEVDKPTTSPSYSLLFAGVGIAILIIILIMRAKRKWWS